MNHGNRTGQEVYFRKPKFSDAVIFQKLEPEFPRSSVRSLERDASDVKYHNQGRRATCTG